MNKPIERLKDQIYAIKTLIQEGEFDKALENIQWNIQTDIIPQLEKELAALSEHATESICDELRNAVDMLEGHIDSLRNKIRW